jgi:2'-5' RNA ligase
MKQTENITKRIFIGAFIKSMAFNENFHSLKKEFSPHIKANWTKPDNLHITAYFLGNTSISKIKAIQNCLSDVLNKSINKPITLNGLGIFFRKQKPYILFVKPYNNEQIINRSINYIQKQLFNNNLITELPHHYTPHITLARIKQSDENFVTVLEKYKNVTFGEVPSIKYEIIESILTPNGPIYKPLQL